MFIISFSFLASAQFTRGNWLVGGTLSYNSSSQTYLGTDQNIHSGNFDVSLGRAISENSVFGVKLGYIYSQQSNYYQGNLGPLDYKTKTYSIGIFYRKYKSLGKEFYLFGEAGAGYLGSNSSGIDDAGQKSLSGSGSGGQINFFPGIDYKISKKFFLEISIPNLFLAQYTSDKTDAINGSQPSKNDQFTISTSLSSGPLDALGIGFRLIL
jgi:hypothetical protein